MQAILSTVSTAIIPSTPAEPPAAPGWGYECYPGTLCVFPRCRLCCYKFEEGDDAIIVTSDYRLSAPFKYWFDERHFDEELNRPIWCCSAAFGWIRADERAIACHKKCTDMFAHLQPSVAFEAYIRQQDTLASMIDAGDENFSGLTVDDASFKNNLHRLHESTVRATVDETSTAENPAAGPAGEIAEQEKMKRPEGRLLTSSIYWYEPPGEAEDTRRLERTKRLLAPALKKAMDGKDRLPLDIWARIAGDLVHEYAICSLLNLDYAGNSQVSLADNIYATYVTIDGRKYVSRLTNSPGANNKLVINVKHRSPNDGLYIMEDHLGIRKVHISQNPPKYDDPKDRTTWWRVYPIGTYDGMLEFSSDGIKLQKVLCDNLFKNCSWSEPLSPMDLADMSFLYVDWEMPVSRLLPVTLNEDDCTGYSICWTWSATQRKKGAVLQIHAHRPGESLDFYNETVHDDEKLFWTYVPLNNGERVNELWRNRGRGYFDITFAFRTSLGRTLFVGPYSDSEFQRNGWNCVVKPSRTEPDRIWVDYLTADGDTVTRIVGPKRKQDPDGLPPVHATFAPAPSFQSVHSGPDTLFYSAASLDEVTEIVPCRMNNSPISRITGLLFRYQNGFEATVGSFRLDCAGEPIKTTESWGLFLGISKLNGVRYVGEVSVLPAEDQDGLWWEVYPWRGSVVWWFNRMESAIHHSDEDIIVKPNPEIGEAYKLEIENLGHGRSYSAQRNSMRASMRNSMRNSIPAEARALKPVEEIVIPVLAEAVIEDDLVSEYSSEIGDDCPEFDLRSSSDDSSDYNSDLCSDAGSDAGAEHYNFPVVEEPVKGGPDAAKEYQIGNFDWLSQDNRLTLS
ncbi:unnamed protein product [Clonostachys rosea]|uniref:Heterokaryon incompatibility domain-containing protein n=1 Tax=Bionectria ochroleuca TaxID=29856 RepID=A0ABY6V384_BIOOC|nr:unnamed protein product [Clonostachys rosea]